MSSDVRLTLGAVSFIAELATNAPQTLAWLTRQLPREATALHARWSGEAAWARLGDPIDLPPEEALAYPAPGALLLYPGGISEPELLIPYGTCAFASRAGPLAGNYFATIRRDLDLLRHTCEGLLLHGALPLTLGWAS